MGATTSQQTTGVAGGAAGPATGVQSGGNTVDTSAASAPTAGQVLTATSGTAATWQTPSAPNVGTAISGAPAKTTPVDADIFPLDDSASAFALSNVTWSNIKATLLAFLKLDVGTWANNTTGNAATSTKLATARAIDGQNFDGTAAITVIAPGTHAATSKTPPADADELPLADSAGGFALKKLTWANLKAALVTYLSGLTTTWGISTTGNAATATSATTATAANGINSATTTIALNGATAPLAGQALVATSSTAAGWQAFASGNVSLSSVAGTNTITATGTPTQIAYAAGVVMVGVAAQPNTGPCTINVDTLGAIALNRPDGTGLQAGDIADAGYGMAILITSTTSAVLLNPSYAQQGSLSCGVPLILPSSGNVGSNGALTGITALNVIYSGGCYMYFGKGVINTTVGGAGYVAGFYYVVMSSTTAGTIYNNYYDSGIPQIPASPTAFSTTGIGAYTQTTSQLAALNLTIPGNRVGPNGEILIKPMIFANNSTNSKTVSIRVGASSSDVFGQNMNSATNLCSTQFVGLVNRGVVTAQSVLKKTQNYNLNSDTAFSNTADFSADCLCTISFTLATATDWLCLYAFEIQTPFQFPADPMSLPFIDVPVTVPADFLGMNSVNYPVDATPNPIGTISIKNARMCQSAQANWSTIETSAGVYSGAALSNLDSIITNLRTAGVSIRFGLYSTPTFYAQTTANPTVGDNTVADPWGHLGGASYPLGNLTALTNFVNMIMTRYNAVGGAWRVANPTLGKGIQYWETWNEPQINGSGAGGNTSGFWWGTMTQLVDLCYTQYAAVKAVDSSVPVLSPGWASGSPVSWCIPFLQTAGTVNPTKTGNDACDHICHHGGANPPGITRGGNTSTYNQGDILTGYHTTYSWKRQLANAGYGSKPIHVGEWYLGSGVDKADWYLQSAAFRYNWVARQFMCIAACGVQSVHPWNWAITNNTGSGNWQGDTAGVDAAYNDFATHVSGKTILSGRYIRGGAVTLNFSDGSHWTV